MNNKYVDLAVKAEKVIKEKIAAGRPYVTYGEVNSALGIDWRTGSHVLGALVELNTEEESPLWSSFVSYTDNRYGTKGWPGSCFCAAAKYLGWQFSSDRDFIIQQRNACRKLLN